MTDKIIFDMNKLSYREISKMASLEGDALEEATVVLMAKATIRWPHDQKCTPSNITNLGLEDFVEYQKAFSDRLNELFRPDGESE